MPKIMVLNDDQRWSDYTGCNIITLGDEAYEKLMNDGKFSCDIPIKEQQQLSEQDTDWESVCSSFYLACGGVHGCGDLKWVDDLVNHFQSNW